MFNKKFVSIIFAIISYVNFNLFSMEEDTSSQVNVSMSINFYQKAFCKNLLSATISGDSPRILALLNENEHEIFFEIDLIKPAFLYAAESDFDNIILIFIRNEKILKILDAQTLCQIFNLSQIHVKQVLISDSRTRDLIFSQKTKQEQDNILKKLKKHR